MSGWERLGGAGEGSAHGWFSLLEGMELGEVGISVTSGAQGLVQDSRCGVGLCKHMGLASILFS